ncbi:phenoloxidase-activating factor 2-like [Malaya genurostris]|uniref:phenoloxidase-activating factor 2-like n=1 Tax=Malaya genurostris TaxID=325434 RepID=UPI0026F3E816|nr:phenoloxidase-activating factor 2-like [Malaya genurostris]
MCPFEIRYAVNSSRPAMDWKVAVLVSFIWCWIGLATAQEDGGVFQFNRRRSTTPDPILSFFNQCNQGKGTCVSECKDSLRVDTEDCISMWHVCCNKEENDIVYFPTRKPPATTAADSSTRKTPPAKQTTPVTTTSPETSLAENWIPPDCGIRQSNTEVNSQPIEDTKRGEFPWNVGIFTMSTNSFGIEQSVFHCGGSLIDDFVVLTAASCVRKKKNSSLLVFAGVWDVTDELENRQIRKVSEIIIHPSFLPTSRIYDVALLVLEDKVDFTSTANRICLPDANVVFNDRYCLATGWGVTPMEKSSDQLSSIMKMVELQLVEHNDCEFRIRKALPYKTTFKLNEIFQCAGDEAGINLCTGDEGSPLFCTIPGRPRQFYQVGIYSWSRSQCGEKAVPDVFTKISQIRTWIDGHMEAKQRNINVYVPQPDDSGEDSSLSAD